MFVTRSAERRFQLSDETYRVRRAFLTVTVMWILYNVAIFEDKVELFGATVAIPHQIIGLAIFLVSLYFFISFVSYMFQDLKEFNCADINQIASTIQDSIKEIEELFKKIVPDRLSIERNALIDRTREHAVRSVRPNDHSTEKLDLYQAITANDANKALAMLENLRLKYQEYYEQQLKQDTVELDNTVNTLKNELDQRTCKFKDILLVLSRRQLAMLSIPNTAHALIDIWTPIVLWLISIVIFFHLTIW